MSCGPSPQNFRLLDAYVGWDVDVIDKLNWKNLSGLEEAEGVRLAARFPGAVDPSIVSVYLLPPRLAKGCGTCEWYLVTPAPPVSRLLRRSGCNGEWLSVWAEEGCAPGRLIDAVAVAARRHYVAVADRGDNSVRIWANGGERLVTRIAIKNVGPIAFTNSCELLVTRRGSDAIRRYDLAGDDRGTLPARLPGPVDRIAVSKDCAVWVVTREKESGTNLYRLWRAAANEKEFRAATVSELAEAFSPTGLVAVSEVGFCIESCGPDGLPVRCCYSWYGRCVEEGEIKPPQAPPREKQGQLLTMPLDSGIPRCKWHRISLDADIPPGTTLAVSVATSETIDGDPQGDPQADPQWQDFPAGFPHPKDWQNVAAGAIDFLVDQPPGRYLFLRMRLTGDGLATPLVRRIRLDFPRSTSLEFLPTVYRENPRAEDFTERFLSLFDASIADLDRAIDVFPALLDEQGVPDEVLPWLGSFLDLVFESSWTADKRRRILRELPTLYQWRGTVAGLTRAIKVVFDVEPAIQELSHTRAWGGLGRDARVNLTRLFGKSRARFRLGSSALSRAPIRSFGNPDRDPLEANAYRFRVLMPANGLLGKNGKERLQQLIDRQKPAHTLASVRVGGGGWVLGTWSAVGVDTAFTPLPAPVLGAAGNIRLNRASVLWSGPRGSRAGMMVGSSAVGLQTVSE